jgi:hypothetical protein
MAGHEPYCFGEARGSRGNSVQGRHYLKIEAAWINLSHIREDAGNAEVSCNTGLEFEDFTSVTLKEAKLVELGADGSFETANRVVFDEGVELALCDDQFFAEHGETFA